MEIGQIIVWITLIVSVMAWHCWKYWLDKKSSDDIDKLREYCQYIDERLIECERITDPLGHNTKE